MSIECLGCLIFVRRKYTTSPRRQYASSPERHNYVRQVSTLVLRVTKKGKSTLITLLRVQQTTSSSGRVAGRQYSRIPCCDHSTRRTFRAPPQAYRVPAVPR